MLSFILTFAVVLQSAQITIGKIRNNFSLVYNFRKRYARIYSMETSSGEGTVIKDIIPPEEAINLLDDNGEHKFLYQIGKGPVYIIGTSLEEMDRRGEQPRLH